MEKHMGIVFFDGKYLPEEEAKVSVLDRGYLSGDGIFTSLQVCNGAVFFVSEHLRRLKQQCEVTRLICPEIDPDWIKQVVVRNEACTGIYKMKIVMSRGQDFAMRLPKCQPEHLLIFLHSVAEMPFQPLRMISFPTPVSTAHAKVKSLAHLNRFCVMEYAKEQGYDDAITRTENGIILESAFANLFWKVGDTIFYPNQELPYYFGVTITMMLKSAESLGFNLQKVQITTLPKEAHLYRCNSMTGLRPVVKVDNDVFERDIVFEQKLIIEYEQLVAAHKLLCTREFSPC